LWRAWRVVREAEVLSSERSNNEIADFLGLLGDDDTDDSRPPPSADDEVDAAPVIDARDPYRSPRRAVRGAGSEASVRGQAAPGVADAGAVLLEDWRCLDGAPSHPSPPQPITPLTPAQPSGSDRIAPHRVAAQLICAGAALPGATEEAPPAAAALDGQVPRLCSALI
jgi:hypothetical protein